MPEFLYTIANWILIGVTCIFGIYLLALPVQKKHLSTITALPGL